MRFQRLQADTTFRLGGVAAMPANGAWRAAPERTVAAVRRSHAGDAQPTEFTSIEYPAALVVIGGEIPT